MTRSAGSPTAKGMTTPVLKQSDVHTLSPRPGFQYTTPSSFYGKGQADGQADGGSIKGVGSLLISLGQ